MGNKIQRIYIGDHYQVYPKWTVNSNTVAYYPLDTDFNDYSGNGWNMTTKAGSPSITTLNGVKCGYFNGSSDIGNNDFHQSSIGSTFTIMSWVNVSGGEVTFFTNSYAPGSSGINVNADSTASGNSWGISFGIGNGSSQNFLRDSSSLTVGSWKFICVTYSDGTAKGYQNGVLTKTITGASLRVDSNGYARIGGYNNRNSGTGERYFSNGYVSRVIIENKLWTADEIADYYNQTKASYLGFN